MLVKGLVVGNCGFVGAGLIVVGLSVGLTVGDAVGFVGVAVDDELELLTGWFVGIGEGVGVEVSIVVGEGLGVAVGAIVGMGVGLGVIVGLGVSVGEGFGVGLEVG